MYIRVFSKGKSTIESFFTQAPFGIKLVTIITIVIFMINLFFNKIFTIWFLDIPLKVLQEYQLQRLFFTQFIETLFGLILVPIFIRKSLSEVEKTLGTVLFLIDFFFKGFMIQVIFLIISVIVKNDYLPSYGLWNVYLAFVSLQCFANPKQLNSIFLCFFTLPCLFDGKFVPYILVLISFLIGNSFDTFAPLILALVEAHCFNYMILRFSQKFIQKLENSFIFRCFKSRPDFYILKCNLQANPYNQSELLVQQVIEFQGKGIKIGGTNNNIDSFETNYNNLSQSFCEQEQEYEQEQDNSK